MIEVRYSEGNKIKVKMEGHALFDVYGKDIVCAGTSALALTFADIAVEQGNSTVKTARGRLSVEAESTDRIRYGLDYLLHGLRSIDAAYPGRLDIQKDG